MANASASKSDCDWFVWVFEPVILRDLVAKLTLTCNQVLEIRIVGSLTYQSSRRIRRIVPGRIVLVATRCAMGDLKETVAINLRRLRNGKGWTQEDLADRVGLSVRYLGQVERAQASMSITVLGRLADALVIDASELVRSSAHVKKARQSIKAKP
jgi:DNA-binding XRE family transcriptional regulator